MNDPSDEFDTLSLAVERRFDEMDEAQRDNSRLALDAAWGLVPQVRSNSFAITVLAALVIFDPDWAWWVKGVAALGVIQLYDVWEGKRISVQRDLDRQSWQRNNEAVSRWDECYRPPFLRD